MSSAIHFINRDDDHGRPLRLSKVEGHVWRSCCWAISTDEAATLFGGWVYLHKTKGEPSFFGGRITAVEPVKVPEFAREDRFALVFIATRDARGVRWRGKDHAMAWTSGVIDALARHERHPDHGR